MMTPLHSARSIASLAVVLLLALSTCVEEPNRGKGPPHDLGAVTKLQRGIATKSDVQRLLGLPIGGGSSVFRNAAGGPREIWYYEDNETTDMAEVGSVLKVKLHQQFLLVFFKGGQFDGYLWTTNYIPADFR